MYTCMCNQVPMLHNRKKKFFLIKKKKNLLSAGLWKAGRQVAGQGVEGRQCLQGAPGPPTLPCYQNLQFYPCCCKWPGAESCWLAALTCLGTIQDLTQFSFLNKVPIPDPPSKFKVFFGDFKVAHTCLGQAPWERSCLGPLNLTTALQVCLDFFMAISLMGKMRHCFFFCLLSFQGHACSLWRFPGQGSHQSYSC